MKNLKPQVLKALQTIGVDVFFYYPEKFKKPPCISYYEIGNAPFMSADDKEYLSEIAFVIDVWGDKSSEVSDIAIKVDGVMVGIAFVRSYAHDVNHYEGNRTVKVHKTMRFEYIGG